MWIFRVLSSVAFLTTIILSVPLGFDVGGRTCGLAFSLSLAAFYFGYSILKLATPDESRFRWALVRTIGLTQWIIIPSLLIWSLNRFSIEPDGKNGWVERTLSGKRAQDTSVQQWIFGPDGLIECATIGSWEKVLTYSTPVFQLCEGFCSLLVIQAAGQISRWLVNRGGRSESWMVRRAITDEECAANKVTDRPPSTICLCHLKFRLFPLAHYQLSRNQQRRCDSHRHHRHMRCLPRCLGHWKRKREPHRKLIAICLYRSMRLPNLYRLSAHASYRPCASTSRGCRFSTPTSHHHGLLHVTHTSAVSVTIHHPRYIQLYPRSAQHHYSVRHHFSCLPPICPLCFNSNHPSGTRIGSSSPFSGSFTGR